MTTAFVNCDVYTGEEFFTNSTVICDAEGTVQDIRHCDSYLEDCEIIDLTRKLLVPGFVDLQINGGGDVLFNESPTVDGIRAIAASHRKYGVTHWLPTFITGSLNGMIQAWIAVREARKLGNLGVLGIHFEGPYLSPRRAGIHDLSLMRQRLDDEILALARSTSDGVFLMTVAAEVVSPEQIALLRDSGVRVAIGHSDASGHVVARAIEAGADLATHLYNAMSPLKGREPGVVGAFLANNNAYIDLILDGHHVDFVSAKVALNAKPQGKAFLITDAMPPVGGSLDSYKLGSSMIKVIDEKCVDANGVLAGSVLNMATAVRNLIKRMGVPVDEALKMASLYPAEYLGISDQLGRIEPGLSANFAILDNDMRVSAVVAAGTYQPT